MSAMPGTDAGQAIGITRQMARAALAYSDAVLPPQALTVAKQCILDWFAVTLPGSREHCAVLLAEELEAYGAGPCSVIGRTSRLSPRDAALANGTASHALDYDDVNRTMAGHPSVAIFPAVLAIAESEKRTGREALVAFVAGYEMASVVGGLVGPSHYARGYHATGTVGAIGATVAAGLLLGLDETAMDHAIGLAATQSAGLKAMFGSMAKPLHAGKAAANGVLAARLAMRGFTGQPGVLEADQGFIGALSDEPVRVPAMPVPGTEITSTLFKYHAACYFTHSTIDCLTALRVRTGLTPDAIATVELHVGPAHLQACQIGDPRSGLEAKFSLTHAAALALCGRDTAALETFTDAAIDDPQVAATRERVIVHGDAAAGGAIFARIRTVAGECHDVAHDTGIVNTDLVAQGARIDAKYLSLAVPVVGAAAALRLKAVIAQLEDLPTVDALLREISGEDG
ncbi:MmgE/PrpD family protein [Sphingobium sp. SCG-1]|uniref:MmgE/PrpD family protein n=1 Tax=Sphingobium sp. SCG-1 TaxID=2072936 RepID=UPI000CD6C642|nr:MmgE/PrpD family protein [Sphingobium sp. SCG-1]AUW58983.1 MmgE/PrpD family protein [Sphingobium sp. SCG-1]